MESGEGPGTGKDPEVQTETEMVGDIETVGAGGAKTGGEIGAERGRRRE